MKHVLSERIETSCIGHKKLLDFFNAAKKNKGQKIELAFNNLSFFDANLSAVLLGMIYWLKKYNQNTFWIDFKDVSDNCNVLIRNGFTTLYTGNNFEYTDFRSSTVPLTKFSTKDVDRFCNYIETDFLKHRGITDILTVRKQYEKIVKWYTEVFGNVDLHANTKDPVFACGQYFPKQGEFKFTLVDLGDGFLKKIRLKDTQINTDSQAINWAIQGNTTKTDAQGGTGLKKIMMYCMQNNADFQITSGTAYWSLSGKKIESFTLKDPFVGSTIHMVFRFT